MSNPMHIGGYLNEHGVMVEDDTPESRKWYISIIIILVAVLGMTLGSIILDAGNKNSVDSLKHEYIMTDNYLYDVQDTVLTKFSHGKTWFKSTVEGVPNAEALETVGSYIQELMLPKGSHVMLQKSMYAVNVDFTAGSGSYYDLSYSLTKIETENKETCVASIPPSVKDFARMDVSKLKFHSYSESASATDATPSCKWKIDLTKKNYIIGISVMVDGRLTSPRQMFASGYQRIQRYMDSVVDSSNPLPYHTGSLLFNVVNNKIIWKEKKESPMELYYDASFDQNQETDASLSPLSFIEGARIYGYGDATLSLTVDGTTTKYGTYTSYNAIGSPVPMFDTKTMVSILNAAYAKRESDSTKTLEIKMSAKSGDKDIGESVQNFKTTFAIVKYPSSLPTGKMLVSDLVTKASSFVEKISQAGAVVTIDDNDENVDLSYTNVGSGSTLTTTHGANVYTGNMITFKQPELNLYHGTLFNTIDSGNDFGYSFPLNASFVQDFKYSKTAPDTCGGATNPACKISDFVKFNPDAASMTASKTYLTVLSTTTTQTNKYEANKPKSATNHPLFNPNVQAYIAEEESNRLNDGRWTIAIGYDKSAARSPSNHPTAAKASAPSGNTPAGPYYVAPTYENTLGYNDPAWTTASTPFDKTAPKSGSNHPASNVPNVENTKGYCQSGWTTQAGGGGTTFNPNLPRSPSNHPTTAECSPASGNTPAGQHYYPPTYENTLGYNDPAWTTASTPFDKTAPKSGSNHPASNVPSKENTEGYVDSAWSTAIGNTYDASVPKSENNHPIASPSPAIDIRFIGNGANMLLNDPEWNTEAGAGTSTTTSIDKGFLYGKATSSSEAGFTKVNVASAGNSYTVPDQTSTSLNVASINNIEIYDISKVSSPYSSSASGVSLTKLGVVADINAIKLV
jgi:hypothetical protein